MGGKSGLVEDASQRCGINMRRAVGTQAEADGDNTAGHYPTAGCRQDGRCNRWLSTDGRGRAAQSA